ncbi:hypothetical protein ACKI1I_25410 [Streptomyces turgidiscabies]|uniref:hypothetical protein n=1 Tax=Streptomyces turgidiscabies TaxID=85558 RepID=UPI0038F7568A
MKYTSEDLTFKEMRLIRKTAGKGIADLDQEDALYYMFWVFKNRDGKFSLEDADNASLRDIGEVLDLDPNQNGEK